MKRAFKNTHLALLGMVVSLFVFSCEKDELEYIEENVLPVIYITGSTDGVIDVSADDAVINKTEKLVTRMFGVHRSGIQAKENFSVDVAVSTADLPSNTIPLQPEDYTLSADIEGTTPVSNISVVDGESSVPLFFTISKTVLDANADKLLAVKVIISNPSRYTLNESLSEATIVVDANSFQETAVNVTDTYIKNPGSPFLRSDGGTTRFGILQDWITNDAAKNISGGTLGGFDSYNGGAYMSMERWDTPSIPNGKIYQTVTLPAGKYQIDVNFESHGISNEAYIAVAAGNTLPDVADIAGTIAHTPFSTPGFQFTLGEETEVSLGIVANLINNQQWFRARSFKLTRYESVFD